MKKIMLILAVIFAAFLVAPAAKADLIYPAELGDGVNPDATSVSSILGEPVIELAKWEQVDSIWGWGEDPYGLGSGGHFTVDVDGDYGDVSWNLTGTGYELWGVVVKNGVISSDPYTHWVVFGVTEDQRLESNGTQLVWAGLGDLSSPEPEGGISHVDFYGNRTSVPEASTILLIGSGLIGLWAFRRKFKN